MPIYGKIAFAWRGGRAAEGACLENMFGSHQRGFESHPLRQADYLVVTALATVLVRLAECKKSLLQKNWGGARVAEWARLLSECWVKPVAGSNPALPAVTRLKPLNKRQECCSWFQGQELVPV